MTETQLQPEAKELDSAAATSIPGSLGRKKSATLLRRIAEAVHGHSSKDHLVFVGPYQYEPGNGGHRLVGPFSDTRPAYQHMETNNLSFDTHGMFGPYQGLKKDASTPNAPMRTWRVKEVVVHLKTIEPDENGVHTEWPIALDGEQYDAVIWQQSAVDKFLVPYYTAVGSLEEGSIVHAALSKPNATGLVHRPSTEWVDAGSVGGKAVAGSEHGVGLFRLQERDRTSPRVDAEFEAVPVI